MFSKLEGVEISARRVDAVEAFEVVPGATSCERLVCASRRSTTFDMLIMLTLVDGEDVLCISALDAAGGDVIIQREGCLVSVTISTAV